MKQIVNKWTFAFFIVLIFVEINILRTRTLTPLPVETFSPIAFCGIVNSKKIAIEFTDFNLAYLYEEKSNKYVLDFSESTQFAFLKNKIFFYNLNNELFVKINGSNVNKIDKISMLSKGDIKLFSNRCLMLPSNTEAKLNYKIINEPDPVKFLMLNQRK